MKSKIEQKSVQDSSADSRTNTTLGNTTAMFIPATRFLGRYAIEQVIGAGGMGEVYRAQDTRLERTVAIKMLPHGTAADSSFRRRFLNEARTVSALNHPNIVAIYDICTEKNVDFIVMEYIHGLTLENSIAKETLSLDQLSGLGSQVALALGAAHAAGIVHRDISPPTSWSPRHKKSKCSISESRKQGGTDWIRS
jgi:serine/threonine protein kinase